MAVTVVLERSPKIEKRSEFFTSWVKVATLLEEYSGISGFSVKFDRSCLHYQGDHYSHEAIFAAIAWRNHSLVQAYCRVDDGWVETVLVFSDLSSLEFRARDYNGIAAYALGMWLRALDKLGKDQASEVARITQGIEIAQHRLTK